MAGLQTLLSPQVLTNVITQVASTSDWLANVFGVQPGGKNIINYGHGRYGAYHIYDNVRRAAASRAPGTAAARRGMQNIGRVEFTYPRMHDSVAMPAEFLHNLGRIDDPQRRDQAGADMINRQTRTLAQLASNWRKVQLVGQLRDELYIGMDGDDIFYDFKQTAGVTPVLRQRARRPAGNKGQLNMVDTGDIIDKPWDDVTADIPKHLGAINAAFQQLCGGHLAAIVVPHCVWNHVINNEHVAAIHGSANKPFETLRREALDPMVAKTMENVYCCTLSVYPDIKWYITDEGLEVGKPGEETYQKIVPDQNALFIGHRPDDGTLSCYEGSEPIAEYDNGPEMVKVGMSSWSVKRSNPTETNIFVLDNAFVCNHVPNSEAYGTVIF